MSIRLSIQIAKTHLLAKKRQTIIASLGVTFGIAMFIFMISFMTGVNKVLEDTALASSPHIRIYKDKETNPHSVLDDVYKSDGAWNVVYHKRPKDELLNLKNGLLISDIIRKDPDVLGVSPQLTSQVFFNYGTTQISGVLAGCNILDEDKLYNISSKMKSGSLESIISSNDVILMGIGLANKMEVRVGDKITIATPSGSTMLVRVGGIFQYGIGTIDNVRCYTNIATVQKVLQKDNRYITDIHIKLKDINKAKDVAAKYHAQFGFKAEDWDTANASILVSFLIRNIMTYVVVTTLLIVAGFGIYNIMNMTIYDKMKDIAILKATGFEGRDVVSVFLLQAMFIGIMGGLTGLLLGFILSYSLSLVPFPGGEFLSIETFPMNFAPKYYFYGIGFGTMTTLLAGYFPSKKASKIDPVIILRG